MSQISAANNVATNWAIAMEDGVVTNSECFLVYQAAIDSGVSYWDVKQSRAASSAALSAKNDADRRSAAADAEVRRLQVSMPYCFGQDALATSLCRPIADAVAMRTAMEKQQDLARENWLRAKQLAHDLEEMSFSQSSLSAVWAGFADWEW